MANTVNMDFKLNVGDVVKLDDGDILMVTQVGFGELKLIGLTNDLGNRYTDTTFTHDATIAEVQEHLSSEEIVAVMTKDDWKHKMQFLAGLF